MTGSHEEKISVLSLFSTKEGLRLLTSTIIALFIFAYLILFYFDFKEISTVSMTLIFVLVVLTWAAVYSMDPFRSNGKSLAYKIFPEVSFFWSTLPSFYLVERCNKCQNQNCSNRLSRRNSLFVGIWFKEIFHKHLREDVKLTLQKGFICRLIFYLKYSFLGLSIISVLTLCFHYYILSILQPNRITYQFLFSLAVLAFYLLIGLSNNSKKPNGIWKAEKAINGQHIYWMKRNENIIKTIVCKEENPTSN